MTAAPCCGCELSQVPSAENGHDGQVRAVHFDFDACDCRCHDTPRAWMNKRRGLRVVAGTETEGGAVDVPRSPRKRKASQ